MLVDDADPVCVAIERDPCFGLVRLHGGDEIHEVLRNRGIWMMVGKGSVALAEQPAALDAELREQCRRDEGSGSVSAVVHDANAARERADSLDDVVDVAVDDHLFPLRSDGTGGPFGRLSQLIEILNVFAVQRRRTHRQLEPVVLGRIV